MPSSLWEDIKKTVKDGVTVAAEKTEEYTKIGKLKVDILTTNRSIDKTFTELGRAVYDFAKGKKKGDVIKTENVKSLFKKIDELKAILQKKEEEIEAVKKEGDEKESSEEPPAPPPAKSKTTTKTSTKATKK